MDLETHKTPSITPRPALNSKDIATPKARNENEPRLGLKSTTAADEKPPETVFSKVFAPTTNGGKFAPHRNAIPPAVEKKDIPDSRAFTPFVDESAKTPFKVFSRPGENENDVGLQVQNAFTPKTPNATFTPFFDKAPAFTPFRDSEQTPAPLTDRTPSVLGSKSQPMLAVIEEPESNEGEDEELQEEHEQEHVPVQGAEEGDYQEGYQDYHEDYQEGQEPLADGAESEESEDQGYYQDPPLGARFGQFNVMTPITERT